MIRGELRQQILADCPEEFEETLKNWIDTVESKVSDIVTSLEITDLSELYKFEDAHRAADNLADSLY